MGTLRLSKFIADSGVASRRKAEELIAGGRVMVDGVRITEQGTKIDPIKHQVTVDGKAISTVTTKIYLAFYKPKGVVSTMSDPEGRPSLGDFFLDREERLFHVGRLDKESEGLILLSNDGEWAHHLSHPSFEVVKRYRVLLDRTFNPHDLQKVRSGIRLEDGMVTVEKITAKDREVDISIHEGRNHVIRRLMDSLGYEVVRLKREEFGRIKLGELSVGRWRHLNPTEVTS
ncbi:MAG: hypothetical protein RLZZ251_142 [Actinomycetota bacterium]|jgi:23S rRNA pseudouridine2605 synthase